MWNKWVLLNLNVFSAHNSRYLILQFWVCAHIFVYFRRLVDLSKHICWFILTPIYFRDVLIFVAFLSFISPVNVLPSNTSRHMQCFFPDYLNILKQCLWNSVQFWIRFSALSNIAMFPLENIPHFYLNKPW